MRALCLSLLLLSATLLPAVPAAAQDAAPPALQRALIVHALKEGTCAPEGDGRVTCILSAILVGGRPATSPVARETPRQALYVTVVTVPTPGGLLLLRATGHQERWAPAEPGRLTAHMVFLDLLGDTVFGSDLTFVHETELAALQSFTPSPAEIQDTLSLLETWFLAARDVI